jgi:uncharacterized protein (DUF1015 family)
VRAIPAQCCEFGRTEVHCYNSFFSIVVQFQSWFRLSEDRLAEIRAFQAYRFNAARVLPADVTTQPYDKITAAMQERYYAQSPYNLIPIEKGRVLPEDSSESNVYTRAAEKLNEWISSGILVKDAAPAIYAYSQDYTVPGTNTRRVRRGFIALGRVEDYAAGIVFPHERTLAAPKADRLELLRHTRAQTGLLFMLYDDASKQIDSMLEMISRTPAAVELTDEYGVIHQLWSITDAGSIRRITGAMAAQKLIIADGHHRYETALAFRDECRRRAGEANPNAPYEFAMMALFNTHSGGLMILPTHRVIRNIANFDFGNFRAQASRYFDWYGYPFSTQEERAGAFEDFLRDLEKQRVRHAIGAYGGGGAFYLFVLKRNTDFAQILPDVSEAQRELDVVLLHRLLIEKCLGITAAAVTGEQHISYEREMSSALAALDGGKAQLAFLLNPVRVKQVAEIALGGGVLPQKSTDFYPKLLSGLVIYRIEDNK